MKLSSNFYISVTVLAGVLSSAYLFVTQSTFAPVFMAAVFTFLLAVIGILQKGQEAVTTAEVAAQQSQQNNIKLEKVDAKLDDNTAKTQQAVDGVDVVHSVVNHQRDVMVAELAELRGSTAGMVKEIAQLRAAVTIERAGVPSLDVADSTTTPATDAVKEADAAKPPTTVPGDTK